MFHSVFSQSLIQAIKPRPHQASNSPHRYKHSEILQGPEVGSFFLIEAAKINQPWLIQLAEFWSVH